MSGDGVPLFLSSARETLQWAAKQVIGFVVPFQQGTRHTTLTAVGQELPERVLREFSRHRDQGSLDHYPKPRATPEAIVKVLKLQRDRSSRRA